MWFVGGCVVVWGLDLFALCLGLICWLCRVGGCFDCGVSVVVFSLLLGRLFAVLLCGLLLRLWVLWFGWYDCAAYELVGGLSWVLFISC